MQSSSSHRTGTNPKRRKPATRLLSAVFAAAMTLSACAVSEPSQTSRGSTAPNDFSTGHVDQRLSDTLPAHIRGNRTIRVASTFEHSPFEYYDTEGEPIRGLDKDIGDALSARLGVQLQFTSMSSEEVIPALTSNCVDMAMSMTGDPDAGAHVDFVDYFTAGGGFLVKKGNPKNVQDLDDICGLTVAIVKGTPEVQDAKRASDDCDAAGKAPVKQDLYPAASKVVVALENTNADIAMIDTFAGAYIAEQRQAQFEVPGSSYAPRPYGIVLPKASTQLTNALKATIDALIADGTYDDILAKWGQQTGAVTAASVNDGVDPA